MGNCRRQMSAPEGITTVANGLCQAFTNARINPTCAVGSNELLHLTHWLAREMLGLKC